jgi:hypothetical protein
VGNGGNISLKGCVVSGGVNSSATPPGNYPPGIDPAITVITGYELEDGYYDDDGNWHPEYYSPLTSTAYSPTDPRYNSPIGLAGNILLDNCQTGDVYANGYGYNWYPANGGDVTISNSSVTQVENTGNNGGAKGSIKVTSTTSSETGGGGTTGNNNSDTLANQGKLLLSQILNLPFQL